MKDKEQNVPFSRLRWVFVRSDGGSFLTGGLEIQHHGFKLFPAFLWSVCSVCPELRLKQHLVSAACFRVSGCLGRTHISSSHKHAERRRLPPFFDSGFSFFFAARAAVIKDVRRPMFLKAAIRGFSSGQCCRAVTPTRPRKQLLSYMRAFSSCPHWNSVSAANSECEGSLTCALFPPCVRRTPVEQPHIMKCAGSSRFSPLFAVSCSPDQTRTSRHQPVQSPDRNPEKRVRWQCPLWHHQGQTLPHNCVLKTRQKQPTEVKLRRSELLEPDYFVFQFFFFLMFSFPPLCFNLGDTASLNPCTLRVTPLSDQSRLSCCLSPLITAAQPACALAGVGRFKTPWSRDTLCRKHIRLTPANLFFFCTQPFVHWRMSSSPRWSTALICYFHSFLFIHRTLSCLSQRGNKHSWTRVFNRQVLSFPAFDYDWLYQWNFSPKNTYSLLFCLWIKSKIDKTESLWIIE